MYSECLKQHCIYSPCKLSHSELVQVTHVKETNLYTCGSSLFPPDSMVVYKIVIKEALTCNSPIEAQYYSAVLVKFPPICYNCGLHEESVVEDEEIKELRDCYAVVAPICFLCRSDGKKPYCKTPSNVAKRQSVSCFF